MKDINGLDLREGDDAQLLCKVIEIREEGVAIRIMNSEMTLFIGCKQDEVLGGTVADSELTRFVEFIPVVTPAKSSPAFE